MAKKQRLELPSHSRVGRILNVVVRQTRWNIEGMCENQTPTPGQLSATIRHRPKSVHGNVRSRLHKAQGGNTLNWFLASPRHSWLRFFSETQFVVFL